MTDLNVDRFGDFAVGTLLQSKEGLSCCKVCGSHAEALGSECGPTECGPLVPFEMDEGVVILVEGAAATQATQRLSAYRVTLFDEPGDKCRMHFDCMAECADHAEEQAESAYPDCVIENIIEGEI